MAPAVAVFPAPVGICKTGLRLPERSDDRMFAMAAS